jgi:histidine phosphotransfer protein HptB
MTQEEAAVDWARFAQARQQLGDNFLRLLGYFSDDGAKSVAVIEQAMRDRNAVAIIGPADLIKNDALQMGALDLAELAEDLEFGARDCIDLRQEPDSLIQQAMALRGVFESTVSQMEVRVNPLAQRKIA